MPDIPEPTHFPVVVIGGGQAGLAAAYELGRAGNPSVVLDAETSTGDQWRRRWPSLRLFTPARHDALPGAAFPAARGVFPGKDDVAADLAPGIAQFHSSDYRGPSQLPPGRALVVGYGTFGAEIAEELAKSGRDVTIAGRPTPAIPRLALAIAGDLWWIAMNRVLNRRNPIGRKAAPRATAHGGPLLRISARDVRAAGAHEVGRLNGAANGEPTYSDGVARPTPDVIIWCTGYRGDFGWIAIDGLNFDAKGYPVAPFGLPASVPGLAFLGVPFQTSLASHLLGGVGRDARDVATHLVLAGAGPTDQSRATRT